MKPLNEHPDFKLMEDPKEALQCFLQASKLVAKVLLWTEQRALSLQTHLVAVDQVGQTFTTWIPKNKHEQKKMELLVAQPPPFVFFNLPLPQTNLFFRAAFLQHQPSTGTTFALPEKVFQVQRRSYERLTLKEGHSLSVELPALPIPEGLQRKKLVDISGGGLAFLTDPLEMNDYWVAKLIPELHLRLSATTVIFAQAEVRHRELLLPPAAHQLRVGMQFTQISADAREQIESFVAKENLNYYARFL